MATIRPAPLAFPALLLGAACLAIGPLFVRMAGVPPIASAFWRLALAVPLLIGIALATRQPRPVGGRAWGLLAIAGVLFAADIGAWHLGIVRTTLGNSVLFGNVSSFMLASYGFVLARSWPSQRFALAMLAAGAGVALLLGRSFELSATHFAGDLLCILAAVFYTIYLALMDRARTAVGAWPALAVATVAGAAAFAPVLPLIGGPFVPPDWTPLVALALLSQVAGQGLVIYAVGHLKPEVSGLGLLIQPVIAAALGWAVYGEAMGAVDFAGAALVLGSLVVARWPERRSGRAAASAAGGVIRRNTKGLLMLWAFLPFRRYFEFSGDRSRRKEYWWYWLLIPVCYSVVLLCLGGSDRYNPPPVQSAVLIGGLASIGECNNGRRCTPLIPAAEYRGKHRQTILAHDTIAKARSVGRLDPTELLIPFAALILLYWHLLPGTRGANRFGPDPVEELGNLRENVWLILHSAAARPLRRFGALAQRGRR